VKFGDRSAQALSVTGIGPAGGRRGQSVHVTRTSVTRWWADQPRRPVAGEGVEKLAKAVGVGNGTVSRIKAAMVA